LLAVLTRSLFSQPTITGVGRYDLVAPGGLSGLTWATSDQYYAILDSGGIMYPVTINIDSATGAITSASLGSTIVLSPGSDLEGIAFNPEGDSGAGSVFVSDEVGPAVREHSLGGSLNNTLLVPNVYRTARLNKSLESLTRQDNGSTIWTSNEEALANDGSESMFLAGTVVRLQRFVRSESGYIANGQLLVLERQVTGSGICFNLPEFRNKIYWVDFTGATDVSAISALDGASYPKVSKTYQVCGLCVPTL